MSHSKINLFTVLILTVYFASCGFVDLRQIGFIIEPDKPDTVLSDSHSPVIIRFDTEMEKNDAEKILQVSSDTGIMRGDLFWQGNDLYFVPVPGWTAGTRYTASLAGIIRSVDGRDLRVHQFISFYAINKNEPPLLEWFSPLDGESVGTGDVVLEFYFSRSMDRLSTETAFIIEGIGNKNFEWSDNDKKLKINAEKSLLPWSSYRWTLKETAKSSDGVPLPKTYNGYFTTNKDQTIPYVTGIYPVLFSGGSWYPTGADIKTGLAPGQGIAVEFNKPMGENVQRSLRFEPALAGRTEMLSDTSIVYIFTKDPEPETSYALIVSPDTRDSEGLKTGAEYRINFIPDIPYLKILSFAIGNDSVIENPEKNIILPVFAEPGTGLMNFSVRFSLGFTFEEKQNAVQKIYVSAFFPGTLAPVALQYASWISDDRLYMRWEGFTPGYAASNHYYKLLIPGGKAGITNGAGMYMKEDVVIYLEAVNEN